MNEYHRETPGDPFWGQLQLGLAQEGSDELPFLFELITYVPRYGQGTV